ncbi:AraC family transcriptional regulator [Leptolyngbyaceae cyanobacterium CCMR0082]|uniref:AraC family transcriptional regulator n=1 Tax=Adonisia turfae CCMR0082 TaxID=2304604 RepID=A0A6M0SD70_9CYAN|nr:AraC family transcriptional regulator [Adonisia turfae]NEZ66266.1 AraC family transcriptional regulator [Adonisia turfae CCMR0082]
MNVVHKGLWYIESHFRKSVGLEDVARASHVSKFHLTRAFSEVMGMSLMKYVRRRRLTEAAKVLAGGAPDILSVALDHGYSSHEAFSRAFKEEFHLTPEVVRSQGNLNNLSLMEPIAMTTTPLPKLSTPRVETLANKRLFGIVERYDCESAAGIPNQWQRFVPYLDSMPKKLGSAAYGVCYNYDDDGVFDYLCGVEVQTDNGLPFGLVQLNLPAQKYAVFSHDGHISEIRSVISAIWSDGLLQSGYEAAAGPMLEKYDETFNSETGLGGFEIWVSIK